MGSPRSGPRGPARAKSRGLTARQFYALIWKDFVVHKRHYIWTLLEITIPVLVCAMAILSNTHQGKPKLENERVFDPDDYERLYGDLNPARHRLLVAPNSSFTRALVDQIDDGAVTVELCESEAQLVELIKREIPVSLDQVKRLLPDESQNVTIGGVVIRSDAALLEAAASAASRAPSASSSGGPKHQPRGGPRSQALASASASASSSSGDANQQRRAQLESDFFEVTSKLDGKRMKIPVHLDLAIRAKDFRLGPEPFPKKYSLGPFLHADHYQATFFMASQVMISRAYINLLASYLGPGGGGGGANSSTSSSSLSSTASSTGTPQPNNNSSPSGQLADIVIPTNDDLIGQRMPYPKYVAHKRLKETTLGTFVAGSQKQKPFVLTMDYCICVGFLVTAIFLAKRIVDEKKSRVRDMLRLVGISDATYYGSHMCNTMLIMLVQCLLITLLFTGHHDAPAQNIDASLMFAILVTYCLAAVMFVMALSTLFSSSTKAIIFTSLLWFGLPEILDRIFKMNSGVIESNGFLALGEHYHLLFCLLPNFGLRLMNRLLTECDIYGEFYDKKQLYGEYRAIWPNLFTVLPLYKTITLGHILLLMALAIPFWALVIYLVNASARRGAQGGLASLSSEGASASPAAGCLCGLGGLFVVSLVTLERVLMAILKAPFKLLHQVLCGAYDDENDDDDDNNSNNRHPRDELFAAAAGAKPATGGSLNAAFAASTDSVLAGAPTDKKHANLLNTFELGRLGERDRSELSHGQANANGHGLATGNGSGPAHLDAGQLFGGGVGGGSGGGAKAAPCSMDDATLCEGARNEPVYFERAPGMLERGVSIRNLCKTYFTSSAKLRRIDAVRNVSLDMYFSQILVLLGHNGAGKTTLIDIISGHNTKSSGQIYIDGHNIDTQPAEARRRVGFCPQFDVLFDVLTVQEHLYFYGIVKGARRELALEIEKLLRQSGLDVHRNKLSKTLSGGYKRKLSLAIAMIAKSRVLILDEPTSGMDPESRRKVWDFLQLIRRDRLILMTTHHMEEADALGDRIAVMSAGQVKCCGSALFLKKVFNAGYHLRISKSAQWNQIAFDELIGVKYALQEKLENVTPHELMYKFDVAETSRVLPALFDDLERAKARVGIFGFGVTVSTMDDVFMKIGVHFKDVEAQEMQSKFELANGLAGTKPSSGAPFVGATTLGSERNGPPPPPPQANGSAAAPPDGGPSPMAGCASNRLQGRQLFRQHVRAMLAKRYQHARKNWFQLLWILSVSLACVASIVILIDFVIFKEELTPEWSREMTLEGAGYGRATTGVFQFASAPASPAEEAANFEALREKAFPSASTGSGPESGASGPSSSTTSTSTTSTTSTTTTTTSAPAPPDTTTSAPASSTGGGGGGEAGGEREPLSTTSAPGATADESASASTSAPTIASEIRRRRRRHSRARLSRRQAPDGAPRPPPLIEGLGALGSPANDSAQFLARYWLGEAQRSGMRQLLTYTDVNTQMIDLLTRQFADFREKYIVGGEKLGKKYIVWYNGEATHAFPISMNIMLNSILKQFTDLIPGQGHPMKGSRISLKHVAMAQINTLIAFLPHLGRLINLVFLPFSLAFITSYFVIFPTHERVTKSKHLQLMTGIPARTFWLSHFLFDLFLYATYTILVLGIYFIWDRVVNDRRIYFANFEHSVALIALVSLFIFGALPLAYIFSFLAKKPTSAFSSFCVLTILTGTATLTLVSLYELKYEHNASASFRLAFTVFLWTARLIPSVSLLVGLQKLFALNTTRSICINISPEVLELLCRYINSPLVDDELRVLKPERCCRQTCADECYDQWPFFWSGWFGVNVELAMLVFDACLLWLVLVLIESRSLRARLAQLLGKCSPARLLRTGSGSGSGGVWARLVPGKAREYSWQVPQIAAGAVDFASGGGKRAPAHQNAAGSHNKLEVRNEQLKVEQVLARGPASAADYSLMADKLTKVYASNGHRAVDGLSFAVDKREFFGLLGVNGAGKSTTFKMLTGELKPGSGNAWIGARDVRGQRADYLRQIGYCPQQDALIDNLTGAEMLTLFARLRGLPERAIKAAVEDTLERLGLARIGHIESNAYSGGNKRRLSVGMALIGAPSVVFLDEPTSGVDPRSRRRLWSTLIEFQKQTKSSIVMTSHSMNECECLCDRVAIMVAGQFQVLGSVQYLRTKLSQGFSLVLKMKPDQLGTISDLAKSSQAIQAYMERAFAPASQLQLRDLHQTIIQYHIQPAQELTWSKMLLALERAKQELDLEDYQITSDASLESIFLALAKQQPVAGTDALPEVA